MNQTQIEVWADVGGTFTDVFVYPLDRDQPLATKTLSSGLTYASITAVDDQRVALDKLPAAERAGFWNQARWSCEDLAGQVVDHVDGWLTLRGNTDHLVAGQSLVLDSGLESPVLAARILLGIPLIEPLPPLDVRLGTTRGTNALLTRGGASTGLLITRGFGDLLQIGEQDREDLFDLDVVLPRPLPQRIVEVDERLDHRGQILMPLDQAALVAQLRKLVDADIESLAICFMHAHVNECHEVAAAKLAVQAGFKNVSRSSQVAPLVKLLSRAQTTTLDAYLNPILDRYVERVQQQFGGESCRLRLMTSGGNLVRPENFRGRDCVLSGPAGGVVALADVAKRAGAERAIGLDMGGTSTDVSRFDGAVGRRSESKVAGVRILTQMMEIETVAAGGGSVCSFESGRMKVGPESAGASPGPACYGRGGPLTVTDINLLLGRLPAGRFPFQLDRAAAEEQLDRVVRAMGAVATASDSHQRVAEGFLSIAISHMAEAVRTVTIGQGSDPREMTLVGFGGAAGGHLCQVAEQLQMTRILDHPDAGLMSALGMGIAKEGHTATRGIYQRLDQFCETQLHRIAAELEVAAIAELRVSPAKSIEHGVEVDLRYLGTESALTFAVAESETIDALAHRFSKRHQAVFGYIQPGQALELVCVRVECRVALSSLRNTVGITDRRTVPPNDWPKSKMWISDVWTPVDLVDRSLLPVGTPIGAPAMIVGDHSTLIVEPGWSGVVRPGGVIELGKTGPTQLAVDSDDDGRLLGTTDDPINPVMVEVIGRRLQGIADTMGEVLRRTSISVNVKERRDYSCAVFRADGSLVANAAHVPVHLGAMGHTVRNIIGQFPLMSDGDCYLSNDPLAGGSHLPDVTLITPVFVTPGTRDQQPDFFVASRAHHAEIGGMAPGSMPPNATCLAEEGVLISGFALQRDGKGFREQLRSLLTDADYPSRNPDENLADIDAQQAAGISGVGSLRELCLRYGKEKIDAAMRRLLSLAATQTRRAIERLPDCPLRFVDQLDDGTKIGVTISKIQADRLSIQFDPAAVHKNGFNATPAIVTAAIMYVLRCIGSSQLPLCDGLLEPIVIDLPSGMLNPPAHPDPKKCPAVVAGNVETSQRIVDVLLGALGVAAGSQGTMNNVLIGDDTFGYYETIGGGCGATEHQPGASGVHSHMTNTRITDPEIVESRLPVRLVRFALRPGSGGAGQHAGGDGLIREFEFLRRLTVSLLTNRRTTSPYGLDGGASGQPGRNRWIGQGKSQVLPSSVTLDVDATDRLIIETPGGGGWGKENRR